MLRESFGELSVDLNLNIKGMRACFTVQRKKDSGVPTAGMTYCGLHDTADAAEAARQANIVKPWSGIRKIDGRKVGLSADQAAQMTQEWLDSTEVVELAEGEVYSPHGSQYDKTHGVNDGATH